MGGFNPQSSGMNRVRAHRRYKVNLHPLSVRHGGTTITVQACTRCRRTMRKTAWAAGRFTPGTPALLMAPAHASLSSQIVIGPSLTSSTCISAPNTPRATSTPCASTASAKTA